MPVRIEYVVTTHDPDRPWIVRATARDSVELPCAAEFAAWARQRWPEPRYAVRAVKGM